MIQILEQYSLSQSRKTIVLTILAAIFIPMGFVAVSFKVTRILQIGLADKYDSHSLE
jgi:hypothetical protein